MTTKTIRIAALAVLATVASAAVLPCRAEDNQVRPSSTPIGSQVGNLRFKDIRFLPRSLSELASKLDPIPKRFFVLCFTNTTCPLVQKCLPKLKELDATYRDRGVQFVAVNVGADDSITDMAAQAVLFDIAFPFVKDVDGSCTQACGVQRTPECVVIDADHRLRYRGRIDSQHRLGGSTPTTSTNDLRQALDELLAGREVATAETPVDGCRITLPEPLPPRPDVSYAQAAEILDRSCRNCHRAGTAAPFALTTYEQVKAQAEMIAEVVQEGRMPPWYASEGVDTFPNCKALPRKDRDLLIGWLRAGLPNHETSEAASPAAEAKSAAKSEAQTDAFADRTWQMEQPDLVVAVPGSYSIPADGYVDYRYAILPQLITEDTWIQQVEILPDNPRVLHHCNLGSVRFGQSALDARLIGGNVPGSGPLVLKDGVALRIPAGSLFAVQIHFTTTGKPETCRLRVGFRFARDRVQKELRYLDISDHRFTVPPFAAAHPVKQSRTVAKDMTVYGMFAHMHVRGKDATFRAFPPNADPQTLLVIPNYHFDWQMPYSVPAGKHKFPAGTRFECLAHFDNSTFNPYNPDPRVTVKVGEQTTSEMMFGFVFYTEDAEQLNLQIDPSSGHVVSQK